MTMMMEMVKGKLAVDDDVISILLLTSFLNNLQMSNLTISYPIQGLPSAFHPVGRFARDVRRAELYKYGFGGPTPKLSVPTLCSNTKNQN